MDMFTQCACVLLDKAPTLEQVQLALGEWNLTARQEAAPGEQGWVLCGAGFVIELRSGAAVMVDLVEHPWPDDPRSMPGSEAIATAWRSGAFGPTASPGSLTRAREQSWAWPEAAELAARHRAFVRLRAIVRLPEGDHRLPKDHDPLHELTTLTELAGALLRIP